MCKIVKTLYFRRDAIRLAVLDWNRISATPDDLMEIADIDLLADTHAERCADCGAEQERRRAAHA